jgi:hypothetical protein
MEQRRLPAVKYLCSSKFTIRDHRCLWKKYVQKAMTTWCKLVGTYRCLAVSGACMRLEVLIFTMIA